MAWGAAEAVELPAWMTTLAGLIIALPAAVTGAVGVHEVRKRTTGDFGADQRALAGGAVWLLAAAAAVLLIASRLGDPATYDPLRDEDGNPEVVPLAFMFITCLPLLFFVPFVAPVRDEQRSQDRP